MGRHSVVKERRTGSRLFGRGRRNDDLFERSFKSCHGCGVDVYVLAEDCRECGHRVEHRGR